MAVYTVVKTIGSGGDYSTPATWEVSRPANHTTAEKSAATTFLVAAFVEGEGLTFSPSGATGTLLETDSTGAGTGTYIVYDIISGNPAASDVVTGTSTATCVLTSGTADNVGVIYQGQCKNQEFSGTGIQCDIQGSTVSSTAYSELTTEAGDSFQDNASVQSNALRYNASNGSAIKGTTGSQFTIDASHENPTKVNKLQISATGSGGRAIRGAIGLTIDFSIMEGTYTASSSTIGVVSTITSTAGAWTIQNSLIILRASGADHIIASGISTLNLYNTDIVAPADLATAPAFIFSTGATGAVTTQNCAMFAGDSASAMKTGTVTPTHTTGYTDIASPPSGVTQTAYSDEFQNVNDATRDYRLVTGAAGKDTGTTDSTHAAVDIAGTARPSGSAYDVGAWEFVQAAGDVLFAQSVM